VSPVLAEQLAAPEFREILREYMDDRIATAHEEAAAFRAGGDRGFAELADRWEEFHRDARRFFFEDLDGDLIGALRDLEETGALELATCGATHGYLPLLGRDESIALQLELACRVHERHFGTPPRGVWLPEAAYRPAGPWHAAAGAGDRLRSGLEEFLSRTGIRYFIVDPGLLIGGRGAGSYPQHFRDPAARGEAERAAPPRPRPATPHDTRLPYWIARDGGVGPDVLFFTRDPATALQVWSGEHGYPGDPAYLEFHKKSDGGGHRYWKVSGPGVGLGDKARYVPAEAADRIGLQADHFRTLVRNSLAGSPEGAIVVAPYDAELFGHWWHEGVSWLEGVLERLHADPDVRLTTLDAHARDYPPAEIVALPEGSWGQGGHHWVWNNPRVDWTWKLIYPSEDVVWELWEASRDAEPDVRRIAVEAVRQLLLAQASDWQFLITTGSAVDYAAERVRLHTDDLARLVEIGRRLLDGHRLDPVEQQFLRTIERRDALFPELADVLLSPAGEAAATRGA
jgi:1,4-alpha-glucan branching enzyme